MSSVSGTPSPARCRVLARSPSRAGILGAAIMIALALVSFFVMLWPAGGYRRFTIVLHGQTWEMMHLVSAQRLLPLDDPRCSSLLPRFSCLRSPSATGGADFSVAAALTMALGAPPHRSPWRAHLSSSRSSAVVSRSRT